MLLENRNKNLTNLHKAADYLSRSLRENFKVFSVESSENKVQFLSENNNLITCNYDDSESKIKLSNLKIDTVDNYLSIDRVDSIVSEGISGFVTDLRNNRFDKADTSFSDVLSLFEDRNNLDTLRYKFEKHQATFSDNTTIVETSEYKKLQEVKDSLKAFITENKDALLENKDISDSIGITNAMSKVLGSPESVTLDTLKESRSLDVDLKDGNNLYEMVCQQELMRQELIESKENFSGAWMTCEPLQKLSSCIFSDENTLKESIAEVIENVPYFSFATKSDLNEVFTSIYEVNSTDTILKKDIKSFVSKIFEAKKPVKEKLVELLSKKYGVNVSNLKFVPTFSNLAKTQSVFFEVLSMCMEEGILQDVTSDFSKMIKGKGGVEVLDVNDIIKECSDSPQGLQENMLVNYVDIPRLTQDLSQVIDVLGALTYTNTSEMGGDEMPEEEMPEEEMPQEEMPQEEMPGEEMPGEEMPAEEGGMPAEMAGEEMPEDSEAQQVPAEMGGEVPAEEEAVVGDDADSAVGLGGGTDAPLDKIMADLSKMLGILGGGQEEEEEESLPADQYGS